MNAKKLWVAALVAIPLLVGAGSRSTYAASNLEQRVKELEEKLAKYEKLLGDKVAEVEAEEKGEAAPNGPKKFKVYWKEGVKMETSDKKFQFSLGGRVQTDWAWMGEDDGLRNQVGDADDGVQFRRAEIGFAGLVYDRFDFKVFFDPNGGDMNFRDVYFGISKIPYVGAIRIGQFYEPIGLEENTPSGATTFLERSVVSAFIPTRNTGVMLFNHVLDDRMTWAAGFFRDTDDYGDVSQDGSYNGTIRLTGLPWYEDEGEKLIHLGVAYSLRSPNSDAVQFRSRPELNQAPRLVDTGVVEADKANLIAAEGALVYKPFALQTEYLYALTQAAQNTDYNFYGLSVQASGFLTGESRPYKKTSGVFDKVRPKHNLFDNGGWGAWELAARYSRIDLDDENVAGGTLDNFTGGVNWYMNPMIRMSLNYIRSELENVGDANAFASRFQFDF